MSTDKQIPVSPESLGWCPRGEVVYGHAAWQALGRAAGDYDPEQFYAAVRETGSDFPLRAAGTMTEHGLRLDDGMADTLAAWANRGRSPLTPLQTSRAKRLPRYWLEWMADDARVILTLLAQTTSQCLPLVPLFCMYCGGARDSALSVSRFRLLIRDMARAGWLDVPNHDNVILTAAGLAALNDLDPE